jgi:hypothetical protein
VALVLWTIELPPFSFALELPVQAVEMVGSRAKLAAVYLASINADLAMGLMLNRSFLLALLVGEARILPS